MIFEEPDEVIFNKDDLAEAILNHTDTPKDKYRITIRNQYPCLCIGHNHYYIHRLLGEFYFGNLQRYSVHHKNGIKTDNTKENLIPMSNSEHTKLHHTGKDFRSEDGMMKSVMAMADAKRRDDVSPDEVKKFRSDGFTYKELCEHFKCGNSVIRRCILR